MTTINTLRQRLELEYLEPITDSSPAVPLASSINDTQPTFQFDAGVLSPDEEAIIGPGFTLEIDNELVYVTSYDGATRTVTCERNYLDSGAVSHADGAIVHFPTRWPRFLQEEAIRDAVEGLNADLFVVKELRLPTSALGYVNLPLNTVALIEVIVRNGDRWLPIEAELFQTHALDGTVAGMQLETGVANAMCRVRYGVSLTVPSVSTDDVTDLPTKWIRLILVDAALAMMTGVDIDAVSQENMTESLRLERFPVRSGEGIVRSLIQYREYLRARFISEQKALNPPMVRMVDTVVLD